MSRKSVYINKISAFLPNDAVGNDDMERILGMVGGKPSRARKMILRSNKIKQRYYAIDPETLQPNYTNAQLASEAIKGLQSDEFSIENIQCLVSATSIADQIMPGHGVMVHGELGNPECEVVTTSGICVSGITALKYAFLSVAADEFSQAVCSASENSSAFMQGKHYTLECDKKVEELSQKPELAFEKDFLRWMLSDGAGAMLLSDTPNDSSISLKIDWIDIKSYANKLSACMYGGALKNEDGSLTCWKQFPAGSEEQLLSLSLSQDVKQLNEYAPIYSLKLPLGDIIKTRNLRPENYDWFLPHFSSGYFEPVVERAIAELGFEIPKERWFTNLYTKGNTGSASIYIILEELLTSGRLKKGHKILCYIPESGRFTGAFIQLTAV